MGSPLPARSLSLAHNTGCPLGQRGQVGLEIVSLVPSRKPVPDPTASGPCPGGKVGPTLFLMSAAPCQILLSLVPTPFPLLLPLSEFQECQNWEGPWRTLFSRVSVSPGCPLSAWLSPDPPATTGWLEESTQTPLSFTKRGLLFQPHPQSATGHQQGCFLSSRGALEAGVGVAPLLRPPVS